MTQQDMADLLMIHDKTGEIEAAISSVFGEIDESNPFRDLQFTVQRMIARNSTIYDTGKDIDEQEFGEILNRKGEYEERAGKLLGDMV